MKAGRCPIGASMRASPKVSTATGVETAPIASFSDSRTFSFRSSHGRGRRAAIGERATRKHRRASSRNRRYRDADPPVLHHPAHRTQASRAPHKGRNRAAAARRSMKPARDHHHQKRVRRVSRRRWVVSRNVCTTRVDPAMPAMPGRHHSSGAESRDLSRKKLPDCPPTWAIDRVSTEKRTVRSGWLSRRSSPRPALRQSECLAQGHARRHTALRHVQDGIYGHLAVRDGYESLRSPSTTMLRTELDFGLLQEVKHPLETCERLRTPRHGDLDVGQQPSARARSASAS